jgi:phosphomevalonate kinase
MTSVTTSAPGKVVLSGEYAVLDGAPAISMAINRRAVVTLAPASGDNATVRSIGLAGRTERTLFDCAVKAGDFKDTDGCSLVLDTSAFVDAESGEKYGIGSSAALMVALCKALARREAGDDEVREIAAKAHRDFQHGIGSGVDIATSITGGLLEFRMPDARATKLAWPKDLNFALMWSGVTASTRERVDRLAVSDAMPSRSALSDAALTTAAAWQSGSATDVIAAYEGYVKILMSFSVDHGLGIFEAGHDALVQDAFDDGLVYKPCGAGGGDIGIALATDSTQLRGFVERAKESGFKHLDVDIDTQGVQITREQQ